VERPNQQKTASSFYKDISFDGKTAEDGVERSAGKMNLVSFDLIL